MPTTSTPLSPRRLGRVIRVGLVLVAFGAICGVAMAAFNLGFMHGTAMAAVALVLYSVPAALLDWPRITLSDGFELLSAIVRAVVGFFKSLFDW